MRKNPDVIILHMCTKSDNDTMYGSWNMKHNRQSFLLFWTIFLPLYYPNNPENQNFVKTRKTPADIIILHMYTINNNHMMYDAWDMDRGRQTFLSFLTIFCTPTTQKVKILKTWKNCRRYHFAQVYQKS